MVFGRKALNLENIKKLRVIFSGGGAIAYLNYTTCNDGGSTTYRGLR
jgi:hypothetical protein